MAHMNKDINEMLILLWARDVNACLQVTPYIHTLCGGFHPSLRSDLLRGWVPIKAMANINDKWGNREN